MKPNLHFYLRNDNCDWFLCLEFESFCTFFSMMASLLAFELFLFVFAYTVFF